MVVPATANLLAKMAAGLADDLASTALMATDKPVMVVPSMNVRMFSHRATQRNIRQLQEDGVWVLGPDRGDMACGEFGYGRMLSPESVFAAIERYRERRHKVTLLLGAIPIERDGVMVFEQPRTVDLHKIWFLLGTRGFVVELLVGIYEGVIEVPHHKISSFQDLTDKDFSKSIVLSLATWVGEPPSFVDCTLQNEDMWEAQLSAI